MRGARAFVFILLGLSPAVAEQQHVLGNTPSNDDVSISSETITSLLSASDQHGTFVRLLQRARLIPAMTRMNGSVFAPTNAAWKEWEERNRPEDDERAFGWLGPGGLDEWMIPSSEADSLLESRVSAVDEDEREIIIAQHDNLHWALRQHLLYHMLNYTLSPSDWINGNVSTEATLLFPAYEAPPPPKNPDSPWIPAPGTGLLGYHGQRLRLAHPGAEPASCGDFQKGKKESRGCVGFDHAGEHGASVWDGSGWNSTDDGGHHFGEGEGEGDKGKDKDDKDDKEDKDKKKAVGVRWGRNGPVIGIDSVLDPPKTLIATLKDIPQLSYIASLLSSSNPLPPPLPSWIDRTPHVTLFLGSDAAFDAKFDSIERGYLEGAFGAEGLARVLAPGVVIKLDNQVGWRDTFKPKPTEIRSVSDYLSVEAPENGGLVVNGTTADMVDIFTANGVIHVISSLILPEGFELLNSAEKVLLSRNATRFVSLMRTANLSAEYIGEPGKKSKDKWTILAPVDDAIEYMEWWGGKGAIPPTFSEEVTAAGIPPPPTRDVSPLASLLKYHIVPGLVAPKDLEDGMLLSTELRTVSLGDERQRLHVEVSDRRSTRPEWEVEDGEIRLGGAMVLGSPVKSGQSIIYFISALLQPPLDVLQTAVADLQLSTYVAAVYAAGLERIINDNIGTTYFIPRNKAFGQLGLAMKYLLLPDARDDLRRMIRYLAVEKLLYTTDVEDGKTVLKTVEGGNVVLSKDPNNTFSIMSPSKWPGYDSGSSLPANGDLRPARMTAHNALTETGVIHIIDNVVLPADMQITPAKLIKGSKQRTMTELMVKAGLGWILEGREPTAEELERVGLSSTVQASSNDDPDVNDLAYPSYTILMPTDKAFSRLNLTLYMSDEKALLELLKLHIIPSNLGAPLPSASSEHQPEHPPRDGLPLALEDDVVYPTLLAPSARYGELAFRAWGENEFFVGVHNARGGSSNRGGRTQSAGRSSVRWRKSKNDIMASKDDPLWRGGMTLGGGVIVLDSVLIPYNPGWWERWGFLTVVVLVAVAGISLLSVCVWWWYITTRRKREGYERVAQEEEDRQQEQANRSWRRLSRSEPRRPRNPFSRNGNGNGNGSGGQDEAVESDDE